MNYNFFLTFEIHIGRNVSSQQQYFMTLIVGQVTANLSSYLEISVFYQILIIIS